jgi:protein TonB
VKNTRFYLFVAIFLNGCVSPGAQYSIGSRNAAQDRVSAQKSFAAAFSDIPSTSDYDVGPKIVSADFPEYPETWQRAGIAGDVTINFIIEENGSVSSPAIVGSPSPELAALALHAILRWKFNPAMRGNKPIRVQTQQTMSFKLER